MSPQRYIADPCSLLNGSVQTVKQRGEIRWNQAALYPGWPQFDRWLTDQIGCEADIVEIVVQEVTSSAVASVAAGANTRSTLPPDAQPSDVIVFRIRQKKVASTINGLQAATYLSTETSEPREVQVAFNGD